MHMADALLSPAVGGTLWCASAATIAYSSSQLRKELDDRKVPLMGVLGAFLFAAQMINFSIPGTGSSGHLGGGLLLSILLGPHAAYLTIASVLVVQALFFADGGLLALGCNIFNMGFFPAFIVFPLVYRKLAGSNPGKARLSTAIMISALLCLQLGPLGVVLETVCSGTSALPFGTFLLLMQPIHLAIGLVEGLITVMVVSFVFQARPEMVQGALQPDRNQGSLRQLLVGFLLAALFTGGVLSWFASKNPDGLEWAIAKVTGSTELKAPEQGIHRLLSRLQEKTAVLPDYQFRKQEVPASPSQTAPKEAPPQRAGTTLAGIAGALVTLLLALLCGFLLKKRKNTPLSGACPGTFFLQDASPSGFRSFW